MFFLTQGLIFGLYAAFLPGPMQAFLLSQIIRSGWKRTIPLAFIPLITDFPVMLVIFFLLSQLPLIFTNILRIGGGFFILYLAWDAFRTAKNTNKVTNSPKIAENQRSTFLKGVTLNLLNPNVYIFWGTIGVPTILTGLQTSLLSGIAFVLGFYGVLITATTGWIALFGTVGNLKPSIQSNISRIIAFVLILVGFSMIFSGVKQII